MVLFSTLLTTTSGHWKGREGERREGGGRKERGKIGREEVGGRDGGREWGEGGEGGGRKEGGNINDEKARICIQTVYVQCSTVHTVYGQCSTVRTYLRMTGLRSGKIVTEKTVRITDIAITCEKHGKMRRVRVR
jgi:hypothetical protein